MYLWHSDDGERNHHGRLLLVLLHHWALLLQPDGRHARWNAQPCHRFRLDPPQLGRGSVAGGEGPVHPGQAGGHRHQDGLGQGRAQAEAELKVGKGGAGLAGLSALLLLALTFTFLPKPCCQLTYLKYIQISICILP